MTKPTEYTLVEKPVLDYLGGLGYRNVHPYAHPPLRARESLFCPPVVAARPALDYHSITPPTRHSKSIAREHPILRRSRDRSAAYGAARGG